MDKFSKPSVFQVVLFWLAVVLLAAFTYNLFFGEEFSYERKSISSVMRGIEAGDVLSVKIRGEKLEGIMSNGERFYSSIPALYENLLLSMISKGVDVDVLPIETTTSILLSFLSPFLPVLLLIGAWAYFVRGMNNSSGRGGVFNFGRSKARLFMKQEDTVTFKDVAGVEEAKEELEEIVDFLKSPQKFTDLGAKIPKGCLLVGYPGTGKTLLAKAIAGEAHVPFFSMSGSDFVEMFVGVGASRVRDMFSQAKKHAPCIVFIDEIDAVGRHRGAGLGGGNDEREQTLNQLLVEMDGFADNHGVIVLAATNRPDVLDPALLRPGRFDRRVTVPLPDMKGRLAILEVYAKKIQIAKSVDLKVLARGTPGFSGAELANLINEAALLAARKSHRMVTPSIIESARDKVLMGTERKSMIMSEEDKKRTAYHEAGHAIVSAMLPASDSIHKATIIPRGGALGMVQSLPEDDQVSLSREQIAAKLAMAMGGRVAEEIVFGYNKVTTGAGGDIKMATDLAKKSVTQWGLSEKIGPVLVGDEKGEVFLGHSFGGQGIHVSEEVNQIVDMEVKRMVEEGKKVAEKLIKTHKKKFVLLAEKLLEHETLSGSEIKDLLAGKKILKDTIKDDNVSKMKKRKTSVLINM